MKNIIKALGYFGGFTITFATAYFIQIYTTFTQLIISLGIAGILILAVLLYIYNWMKNKDEELEEINESIDRTRDYIREVEGKIKWIRFIEY